MAGKNPRRLTDYRVRKTVNDAQEMFENFEKKILDLNHQIKFIKLINATLDLEQMVKSLLFTCQGNMLVSSVALFLPLDLDNTTFFLKDCVGYERESFNISISARSPLIRLLKKSSTNYLHFSVLLGKNNLKSATRKLEVLEPDLLVPLKVKENLNGMLVFGKKLNGKEFNNSEYKFVAFIADVAGIAMENARLYEMATQDRMSGLFVHHYFKNALFNEFSRAKRYGTPLSLIMMDIDFFKKVNDTYGHQRGDVVIQQIAHLIRDGIRDIDIAARYGGEEFTIILPETGIEAAQTVAERLRESIADFPFATHDDTSLHITASFGISTVRKTTASSEELIEEADRALYQSKRNGRNQVSRGKPIAPAVKKS